MQELIISVYGSHNAAVSMYYKGKYYVVEVERWTNIKNSGLITYLPVANPQAVFDDITEWLLSKTEGEEVDVYLTGYAETIKPKFKYKKKITYDHHTSHAADAFYQSPYNEMLVFTFDGGGDGAFFNVYTASRQDGLKLIGKYNHDLGFPYMLLSEVLDDIKREDLSIGNLVYAGKLMGLCAYGDVVDEWVEHFNEFYSKFHYDGVSYIGGTQVMEEAMKTLMQKIGVEDYEYGKSRYTGQLAWNIAATSQRAFENTFYKLAQKYLDKYPEMPVGMSGGCALNVLLNTRLAYERSGKVFVPPNTSDCGMSIGAILWYQKPQQQVDLTYSGLPVMDEYMFSNYVNQHGFSVQDNVSVKELAGYIAEGHIVGLIQGNGEHGSRALGNRSIICSPTGNMKDIINFKVKKREWYRPFAPVVRFEDVSKYFDFEYESRHMTYAAPVREEFKPIIPAVTHEDGTGRLQTVTRPQNQFLYDLVTEFNDITGVGVLLNTSFNVNGKPILSTLADAFDLLKNSSMDAVYFKGRLVFKHGNESAFRNIRDSKGYNVIPLDPKINKPTVCLIHDGEYSQSIKQAILAVQTKFPNVVLVASENVCQKVIQEVPTIKTYEITNNKFYHYDRLIKCMREKDIPSRLKLIWLREVCDNHFKMMNSVAAVDFSNTSNVKSMIKSLEMAEQSFYKNTRPLHHDNAYYKNGFGVLVGKVEDLTSIVNITESLLMIGFAEGVAPMQDKQTLPVALMQYNKDT